MVEYIELLHDYQPHWSSGILKKGATYKVAEIYNGEETANHLIKGKWAREIAASIAKPSGITEPRRPEAQEQTLKVEKLEKELDEATKPVEQKKQKPGRPAQKKTEEVKAD